MKVNINDVLTGLNQLAEEGDINAKIVSGALGELDYRMFNIPYTDVNFEDFCESTGIDEDELSEAMKG